MTEQETNLVLEHLQRIQTTLRVIEADFGDLKTRIVGHGSAFGRTDDIDGWPQSANRSL
jgi:hypothetical protein